MVSTVNKITTLKRMSDTLGRWYSDSGYSGRGMMGEHCAAIACEVSEINDVIASAGRRGINGAKTDSLGKGAIVYWPGVKID